MSADIHDLESNKPLNVASDTDYVSKIIKDYMNRDDASNPSKTSAAAQRAQKFYSKKDVVQALSKMQLTYRTEYKPGQLVNINTDDFKSTLTTTMSSMGSNVIPRSVNQIDGRTVDFVEMIFGAFLRDRNISPVIKSLLLKLQIPVIKVALLDMKFFYDPKHPSRVLLDTIAHIGIGLDDSENTVYQTIDLIIQQLLRSFNENLSTLHTAIGSLSRLKNIEKQKQEQNEKETRRQIAQEHARQLVLAELQLQMKGKTIPKPLQPLILKYWSTHMYQVCLKCGKNSDQFKDNVSTLRRVINTLQPITSKSGWMMVHRNSGKLVDHIREELADTRQNKELIYNSIRVLENTIGKLLEASEFKVSDDSEITDTVHEAPDHNAIEMKLRNERLKAAQAKLAQLPENIKPGMWFEIHDAINNRTRRFKLSIIIQEHARLVFVDRLGKKGIEKDAGEFASELKSGKSCFIADHSIFNHALGEVISNLAAHR